MNDEALNAALGRMDEGIKLIKLKHAMNTPTSSPDQSTPAQPEPVTLKAPNCLPYVEKESPRRFKCQSCYGYFEVLLTDEGEKNYIDNGAYGNGHFCERCASEGDFENPMHGI